MLQNLASLHWHGALLHVGFLLDEYLILELVSLLSSFGVEELDRCLCEGICIKAVYRFASLPSPFIQAVYSLKCSRITSILSVAVLILT